MAICKKILSAAAVVAGSFALLFTAACSSSEQSQPEKRVADSRNIGEEAVLLDGAWKLSFAPQPREAARTPSAFKKLENLRTIDAEVPGVAQLDLQRAGIEPDAMIGDNVYRYRKYEHYQWMYSRTFATPKLETGQRAVLNLRGVDTLADVFVNGVLVGSPENMFIEHEYDITPLLKKFGANTLEIIIRSPVIESKKYANIIGSGTVERTEYLNIRKAPSSFGWDIHPRIITAGLWRSATLDIRNEVHIEDVNVYTVSADAKSSTVRFGLETKIDAPYSSFDSLFMRVEISKDGKKVFESKTPFITYVNKIDCTLKNAELWWPRGYGAQPLYDIIVNVCDENGNVFAARKMRTGFRTVRLEFAEVELPADETFKYGGAGTAYGKTDLKKLKGEFKFYVNDVPIFMKGTNWVPLDAYHSRDKQHVKRAVDMLADLNCNMVRCWGGNVYEDHEFFDLCDKYGILVWQDFSLACCISPQDSGFAKKMEAEVSSVVRKLRSHPSIALWAGNNEIDQAYFWRKVSPKPINPAHDRISRQTIPNTILEYDWSRPYLPSSPYLSEKAFANPEKYSAPEVHLWGARGYYKTPFYNSSVAPFVSEIGYHGCPNRESLEKMMTADFVYPWNKDGSFNKQWQAKATMPFANSSHCINRNKLMPKQVQLLFGECPKNLDDFILASQVVQAEAKKYFIEVWRTQKFENKTGILWWNLIDGWPILSDAIVDYYGSKKLAYSYIKRVQTDVCAMVDDAFRVVVANDTQKDVAGSVKVSDVDSGRVVFESGFKVSANGKADVGKIAPMDGQGMLLIEYEVGGKKFYNHYMYGKPPFNLTAYKRWMGSLKLADCR